MPRTDTLSTKLIVWETAKVVLRGAAQSGDAFPPLKSAASGAVWILDHLMEVKAVKSDFCELERLLVEFAEIVMEATRRKMYRLLRSKAADNTETNDGASTLLDGASSASHDAMSRAVERLLEDLNLLLRRARRFLERHKGKSWYITLVLRVIFKDKDRDTLKSLEKDLRDTLERFKIKAHLTHGRLLQKSAKYIKSLGQHLNIQGRDLKGIGHMIEQLYVGDKLSPKVMHKVHKVVAEASQNSQVPQAVEDVLKRLEVLLSKPSESSWKGSLAAKVDDSFRDVVSRHGSTLEATIDIAPPKTPGLSVVQPINSSAASPTRTITPREASIVGGSDSGTLRLEIPITNHAPATDRLSSPSNNWRERLHAKIADMVQRVHDFDGRFQEHIADYRSVHEEKRRLLPQMELQQMPERLAQYLAQYLLTSIRDPDAQGRAIVGIHITHAADWQAHIQELLDSDSQQEDAPISDGLGTPRTVSQASPRLMSATASPRSARSGKGIGPSHRTAQ
ncbi:hypothetical protein EXIGLDRAFT_754366 [Exidia glandulosa HHB12029]|uniref:Uncharacterized protein n=1 Tax=Exidia glandulosa HHB12029 TaxID=1314781 RepID=A0A165CZ67_EXIGL|nr:hypothetical protein EXIGLDRAFT_754366 [Exidia glandulosa HHB12029]